MFPECEKLFEQSYDSIVIHYASGMKKLRSKSLSLDNVDLDTGKETTMGEYQHADEAYFKLLMKLKRNKFVAVDEDLKKNILAFFKQPDESRDYRPGTRKGKKIKHALEQLYVALDAG